MSLDREALGEWKLRDSDRQQIAAHGLTVKEVERQLALLDNPPPAAKLHRACRIGDGIVRLEESRYEHYQNSFHQAVERGRFSKFVPASGAASRMFKDLLSAQADDEPAANPAAMRLLAEMDRIPFRAALDDELQRRGLRLARLAREGQAGPVLDAMLGEQGLGYASAAKALIPFHREARGREEPGGRGLTALEEQLVEAAEHLPDGQGQCRIHFTIPQHQELIFRSELRKITARLEKTFRVSFEISLSVQGPETDTVAGALGGGPFRDEQGRLVFRPGGHGALLGNLQRFAPDLVFVRNIDNIQPAHRRREVLRWNRILGGYLVDLEARLIEILSRVERARSESAALGEEISRVAELLGRKDLEAMIQRPGRAQQAFLIELLDRPLRVAGVVPNTGEPGGGPFWVEAGGGVTPQIVELSQIDRDDPTQNGIVEQATHFNPVHLVCRIRDHRGNAYDLTRFVDPTAVFTTTKSHQGRELKALERPGLWNGSMARWNTVFVEVPGEIFAPVKTVFDLLRPEHQPES